MGPPPGTSNSTPGWAAQLVEDTGTRVTEEVQHIVQTEVEVLEWHIGELRQRLDRLA